MSKEVQGYVLLGVGVVCAGLWIFGFGVAAVTIGGIGVGLTTY